MASLKEIKGRIASVKSTLKITSAMKLVASAKLRKAQLAITNMLPYQRQLQRILSSLQTGCAEDSSGSLRFAPYPGKCSPEEPSATAFAAAEYGLGTEASLEAGVAIVAFSSNSSLCGAFNSNVIKKTLSVIDEYRSAGFSDDNIVVYSVGRKMADAMRKAGFPSPADFSKMAETPGYEAAAALAQELIEGHFSGRFARVELVYNHFKSTSSQPTIQETYLPNAAVPRPYSAEASPELSRRAEREWTLPGTGGVPSESGGIIIEPSRAAVLGVLIPKVQRLKIYTVLLDSNAAEHAARTVAMQTATDNGNDLLEALTLEYNKGRQQKITSEI
ncbi:MAG: ATP synthase F1 subunit gamma, partial [Bacteroidales bacterium]|nr:ATP synthase F1 subunit gamma [Bacteroidales bacterium]